MADHGVVILPSFYESIRGLEDLDRLAVLEAIIRYGLYGEVVDLPPCVKGYFMLIQPVIDSSIKKYKAAVENGKKGGRPKKPKKNQTKNQTANHDYDIDKDYDLDIDTDSDSESERETEVEKEGMGGEGGTKMTGKYTRLDWIKAVESGNAALADAIRGQLGF